MQERHSKALKEDQERSSAVQAELTLRLEKVEARLQEEMQTGEALQRSHNALSSQKLAAEKELQAITVGLLQMTIHDSFHMAASYWKGSESEPVHMPIVWRELR